MDNSKSEQYICIKSFFVDKYDDDGFYIEGKHAKIKEGEVFEKEKQWPLSIVVGSEGVRLSNARCWIEIAGETFKQHFQKIEE